MEIEDNIHFEPAEDAAQKFKGQAPFHVLLHYPLSLG